MIYMKQVYIDEDGRKLSLTAMPSCNLHPDWEVEYIEGEWVRGRAGSLLFIEQVERGAFVGFTGESRFEYWECDTRGQSGQHYMLHPHRIVSGDHLEKFWQDVAEGDPYRRVRATPVWSSTILVEAVKLTRLIPGGTQV